MSLLWVCGECGWEAVRGYWKRCVWFGQIQDYQSCNRQKTTSLIFVAQKKTMEHMEIFEQDSAIRFHREHILSKLTENCAKLWFLGRCFSARKGLKTCHNLQLMSSHTTFSKNVTGEPRFKVVLRQCQWYTAVKEIKLAKNAGEHPCSSPAHHQYQFFIKYHIHFVLHMN